MYIIYHCTGWYWGPLLDLFCLRNRHGNTERSWFSPPRVQNTGNIKPILSSINSWYLLIGSHWIFFGSNCSRRRCCLELLRHTLYYWTLFLLGASNISNRKSLISSLYFRLLSHFYLLLSWDCYERHDMPLHFTCVCNLLKHSITLTGDVRE